MKLNFGAVGYFFIIDLGRNFVSLGLTEIVVAKGSWVGVPVGGDGGGGDGVGGRGGGQGDGGEAGGEEGQLPLLIRNISLSFEDWIYLIGIQLVMTALVEWVTP